MTLATIVGGGCAENPWAEAYTSLGQADAVERAELVLVDFDKAQRDRLEDGHEAVGYASFTGVYSRSVERDLRAFAQAHGATFVVWGARHMHTEVSTELRAVFETYSSRRRGEVYDAGRGRYVDRDRHSTTSVTRYVPVVNEDAIYAFRAVFYRPSAS